jgi:plasmid replication initiation protein
MITDISKANDNWVYQSNKLIEASYSLTVLEQKLIRFLASMIKKNDEDFKEYNFKATDLSKILNINQKNIYMELDKATDKLMSRYIKIKSDEEEKFKKRHLIKLADFENGILTMKIDEEMKDFYLELRQYTKYQLKNIMQFKGTYSFRLFELLKQYEKIGSRTIDIEELRIILDINKKQYPKYANLKQKVITKAIDEINNNTDLHIDYEENKETRKVKSIKFYIKPNTTKETAAAQEPAVNSKYIKKIQAIISEEITDIEASRILDAASGDIEKVNEKYDIVGRMKKVNNVVGAMIQALREDWKSMSKTKVSTFNDFEHRVYDYDDLEKQLLGWSK